VIYSIFSMLSLPFYILRAASLEALDLISLEGLSGTEPTKPAVSDSVLPLRSGVPQPLHGVTSARRGFERTRMNTTATAADLEASGTSTLEQVVQ